MLHTVTRESFGRPVVVALLAALSSMLVGCEAMSMSARETLFGTPKRDILVDRVEDARDAQTEVKEQFSSALEEFMAVVKVEGGELEERYNSFKREFERSEARAKDVSERIDSVEYVAEALFDEWEAEIEQIPTASDRRTSQRWMFDAREQYDDMIAKMRVAESKMEPVLTAFRGKVLLLKHSLNARAIASIGEEAAALESDIAELVADMEAAIAEANAFIESISGSSAG